jgi:hypothetical protein
MSETQPSHAVEATDEIKEADADEADAVATQEPSVEQLLTNILGGGDAWSDLNGGNLGQMLGKQTQELKARMKREAMNFKLTFIDHAPGRAVLDTMLNQTLRSAQWPVHQMQNAEMLMAVGIWREAQSAFVAAILEAIATAQGKDMKPRSDT